MNIKTIFWICQCFFEQINPNIYYEEDEEDVDPEILDDIKNDYLYVQDWCKGLLNPNSNSIKND
jgi:hypothetical protein